MIDFIGPTKMSAIRGVQVKYEEVYIGTLRSVLRRTTKECAICVGPI
jgi:hypothetical protein